MVKLLNIPGVALIEDVESTLKVELEKLGPEGLHLEKCAVGSGYFSPAVSVLVLSVEGGDEQINAEIAVLFTEIDPAYCCPMVSGEHHGICNMSVVIDKITGDVSI